MLDWLKNEESGQGMVEYGLILVLVSIVAIAALKTIGDGLGDNFKKVKSGLDGDVPAGTETTTP